LKLKAIATEKLPQAKPNLILLGKFLLMAIGFILGRRLHIEIHKAIAGSTVLLKFKSLLGAGDYVLDINDVVCLIVSFVVYWITSRKVRVLRWFGVGMLLYIVTFEAYELMFGQTMGFEVPIDDLLTSNSTTTTTEPTVGQ